MCGERRARAALLVWVGIFALALCARLIYLYQVEDLVFFHHLVGDAKGYDDWAQRIAAGTDVYVGESGSETFYQAPLYPYFLGFMYKLMGHDPWLVRVVQSTLGAVGCVMIAVAASLFLTRRVGWVAGVMMALYPPAIYFDGLLQKTALGSFLMVGLLCLLAWGGKRSSWRVWLGVGMVLGMLALTRENLLVLVPLVAGWLLLRPASDVAGAKSRGLSIAMLVIGAGVTLSPVILHNYRAGGEFALTTFQMGPNFYIGNHQGADGRYAAMIPGRETSRFERTDATTLAQAAVKRELSPREVSAYWLGQAWSYIKSDPIGWFKLLWIKWWLTWNRYEIPDTESYYIYRDASWLLGGLGGVFHFGLLCPLGGLGVVLTWSQRRRLGLLYLIMLTIAASVAAFYVFGRYRYPIVPVLVIFSAAGVVEGIALAASRAWWKLSGTAGLVMVVALWVNYPINPESELNAAQLGNLGATLAEEDRLAEAIPYFEQAVATLPNAPRLRQFLADALSFSHQYDQAIPHYRVALALEPGRANADFNLAVALEAVGRRREAVEQYLRALQVNPKDEAARRALQRLNGNP